MTTPSINSVFNKPQVNQGFAPKPSTPVTPNNAAQPVAQAAQTKDPVLKYHPAVIGLFNLGAWTAAGYLVDRGITKVFSTETPRKVSLAIGAAVGIAMGYHSYSQAKHFQKENNKLDTNA